jgi:uncharacterized membrane protein YeiH
VIALGGAVLYVALEHFQITHNWNIFITVLAIFLVRLMAIWRHIEVPKFDYAESSMRTRKRGRKQAPLPADE